VVKRAKPITQRDVWNLTAARNFTQKPSDEFTKDAANPSPMGLEPFEQLEIKERDLRPWVRSTVILS
jgi:hypothetical protein